MRRLLLTVVVLAVALTAFATVGFPHGSAVRETPVVLADAGDRSLRGSIDRLQERLREQPRDAGSWATLGLAYVEQARLTADPSYYPKATAVLDRSLREQPRDNEAALSGRAALAAARHDFHGALQNADSALAINPYSARALAVRVDALVELGRYDRAWQAVQQADARRPGIPIFTRYAYVLELRGSPDRARKVLERALGSATDSSDISYLRFQLGDLAFNTGDAERALRLFTDAFEADPQNLAALDGRARAKEALRDLPGAIKDREVLVRRVPLPSYASALGELYARRGQGAKAREQYGVVGAWAALAKSAGVDPDLEIALFEADHGDPKTALASARAEWTRRCGTARTCSISVSDALAWALHANGRDREALVQAAAAARTGYRNILFTRHLRAIEKRLSRK